SAFPQPDVHWRHYNSHRMVHALGLAHTRHLRRVLCDWVPSSCPVVRRALGRTPVRGRVGGVSRPGSSVGHLAAPCIRLLTIVGGDRERAACTRCGRGRDCAPTALDRALLGGPSTSPLGVMTGIGKRIVHLTWADTLLLGLFLAVYLPAFGIVAA